MIQHIRILSIFPFVRISKIRTYAPSYEMNRPPKWCPQPEDWHLAQDATHKPTTHHLPYNSFQNHKPSFGEHFILLSDGCSADNAVVK